LRKRSSLIASEVVKIRRPAVKEFGRHWPPLSGRSTSHARRWRPLSVFVSEPRGGERWSAERLFNLTGEHGDERVIAAPLRRHEQIGEALPLLVPLIFLRQADEELLSEAEERLADRTVFTLDAKKWDAFVAALDAPPRRHTRLERLFREHSVFDPKSEP